MTVAGLLAGCDSTPVPAEYTLKLTGTGSVGLCYGIVGTHTAGGCEEDLALPLERTRITSVNLYFQVRLLSADSVYATVLRDEKVCLTKTLIGGKGSLLSVQCP